MTMDRAIHPRQCRAARGIRKLTQAHTAKAIGVSALALSLFERGQRQLPPAALTRLINFFNEHRVTFWMDGETGIYFELPDGCFAGITVREGLLR